MYRDSSIQRIFDDIVPFPLLQGIIDMISDEGIKPPKIEAIGKSGSGDMVVERRWEYHRKRRGGCRMVGWISAVCGAPRNFLRACCNRSRERAFS
jgi:hypothetical protein